MKRTREPTLKVKRVYEPPARSDGCRILVDGLWPRGVSKDAAAIDAWARDVAPSRELRSWFGHEPAKWAAFKRRYFAELAGREEAVEGLLSSCKRTTLTLVFGAKDCEHNNAVALKEYLERHFASHR